MIGNQIINNKIIKETKMKIKIIFNHKNQIKILYHKSHGLFYKILLMKNIQIKSKIKLWKKLMNKIYNN
jgi:hypothetical protein